MSDDKDALIYLADVRIDELKAENAKLREELAKWERLTAGINLPDYPVSQFVPKYIERENAELRELVKECHELLQDLLAGWTLQPLTVKVMEQRMRELGVDA